MANNRLWDEFVPAILQTKVEVIQNEKDEKDYNPFMVNRALSFHKDCIYYANEMNERPFADKKMQFDYLINTVRSQKRPYQKWVKRLQNNDADLMAIKVFFGYSNAKAEEALKILSVQQVEAIVAATSTGGVNKK